MYKLNVCKRSDRNRKIKKKEVGCERECLMRTGVSEEDTGDLVKRKLSANMTDTKQL